MTTRDTASIGEEVPATSVDSPQVGRGRRKAYQGTDHVSAWWHLFLAPMALVWMIPVAMVVGVSLTPSWNPETVGFGLFPAEPTFNNYVLVWQGNPVLRFLANSVMITLPSVALLVVLASSTAFALARLRVPAKPVFFSLILVALVLPMSSIVVPTFQILKTLGLYNNLAGVVLVYTALGMPFAVIILRSAYLAVPYELYEAARVDGCNAFQIYWRIYFPLGRAALAVVVVWQSMMTWNDFLLPLVSIADNDLKPLTLIPLAYRGLYLSQPGALFAVLVLISIPMVAIFLFVQRYLVSGLSGAIK